MSEQITESLGDFETQWIFAEYESGRPVSEIAAGMKISVSRVYAKMRVRPKTYEEIKCAREELYCRRLRRVRGMADEVTMGYLERLAEKIAEAKTEEEFDALYGQIEKVLKIGKQYGDRVQLAEGKATANVGTAGGLPFKIVVTKNYEKTTVSGQISGDIADDAD
ncbi:MAG: hypothetical protein DRP56_03375 [Planctomycetota bacterium]|nr:MAG: hypothetical protein DRP56_03375 [Planctomycetota bacterium]